MFPYNNILVVAQIVITDVMNGEINNFTFSSIVWEFSVMQF